MKYIPNSCKTYYGHKNSNFGQDWQVSLMVVMEKSQTWLQWLKVHYSDWFSLTTIYASLSYMIHDLELSKTAKPNSKIPKKSVKLKPHLQHNSNLPFDPNTLPTLPGTICSHKPTPTLKETAKQNHGLSKLFHNRNSIFTHHFDHCFALLTLLWSFLYNLIWLWCSKTKVAIVKS